MCSVWVIFSKSEHCCSSLFKRNILKVKGVKNCRFQMVSRIIVVIILKTTSLDGNGFEEIFVLERETETLERECGSCSIYTSVVHGSPSTFDENIFRRNIF